MKLRLLIVEDDRLLAEAVSDYFENKGWDTVTQHTTARPRWKRPGRNLFR